MVLKFMWTKRGLHLFSQYDVEFPMGIFESLSVDSTGQRYHLELNEAFPLCRAPESQLLCLWNFNGWFSVPKELTATMDNAFYTLNVSQNTVAIFIFKHCQNCREQRVLPLHLFFDSA